MNSTLSDLPGRAMQLASQVGSGIKDAVPDKAIHWVETGAALSALRTGTKVATRIVRRNPVVAVAAAAGAGLLWYAAHRKAQQVRNADAAIDGSATRIETKRAPRAKRSNGASTPTTRRKKASTRTTA